jgi:hypothetical protein
MTTRNSEPNRMGTFILRALTTLAGAESPPATQSRRPL